MPGQKLQSTPVISGWVYLGNMYYTGYSTDIFKMNELELYILMEIHIQQYFLDKGSFTRIQNLTYSPVSSGCKYFRETWKGKVACLGFWLCVFLQALNVVLNHWTFCLDVIVFIPWLFSSFISLWLRVYKFEKGLFLLLNCDYMYMNIYMQVSLEARRGWQVPQSWN